MRGRILSRVFLRSSVSPGLQSACSFENVAETSACTLNSSAYHGTNCTFPDFPASSHLRHLDQNLYTSHGILSPFKSFRCIELSAFLPPSPPSHTHVEAQRRSFVAAGNTEKFSSKTCWACEQELSSGNGLFCPSCNAIQPLDLSVDHFTIFGIERSFQVDTKLLEQRYKSLQKKLHPDLMSSKPQKEQGFSADQSSHVIQAYYTLLRPLSRARYLLGLNGIRVDEEGTVDEPALLMEIMEIRESLEYVSDAKELQKLRAQREIKARIARRILEKYNVLPQIQNHSRIQDTEEELERTFGAGDLKKAVSSVQRLAYYIKVDEEIVRKL